MKKVFTVLMVMIAMLGYKNSVADATTQIQTLKNKVCIGGDKQDNFLYDGNPTTGIFDLPDGSKMLFGYSKSATSPFGNANDTFADLICLKMDASGNTIWKKNLGLVGFEYDIHILQNLDSTGFIVQCLLFGNDNLGTQNFKGIIRKIDNDGNSVWINDQHYLGNTNLYGAPNVKVILDDMNGQLVYYARYNTDSIVCLYINNLGATAWKKIYDSDNFNRLKISSYTHDGIFIQDRFIMTIPSSFNDPIMTVLSINRSNGSIINYVNTNTAANRNAYISLVKLPNNNFICGSGEASGTYYNCYTKELSIVYKKKTRDNNSYDLSEFFNSISHQAVTVNNSDDSSVVEVFDYTNGNTIWRKLIIPTTYVENIPSADSNTVLIFYTGENDDYGVERVISYNKLGNIVLQKYIEPTTIRNNKTYFAYPLYSGNNYLYGFNPVNKTYAFSIIYADSLEQEMIFRYIKYNSAFNKVIDVISNTFVINQALYESYNLLINKNNELIIIGSQASDGGVSQSDCNLGRSDLKLMYFSPNYNSIAGKTYIDNNNNNIYNAGTDVLFTQGYVKSTKGNINQASYLNTIGEYNNLVDTGTYNTIFTGYNNYYTVLPISKTTTHTTYGNIDTVDFALRPKGNIKDLRVSLINTWVTRPGFTNSYEAVYVNEGTTIVSNASVVVVLDNRLTYNSAVPSPTSIVGDTLKWNLAALNPSQQGKITINFTGKVPPTLNGNDSLLSKAVISPVVNDTTPVDNNYTLTDIARNAFDPNDKNIEANASLTPTQVASGNYITYRVRFQNTGNFYATNVIIKDTLEANLDWSSLQVISSSHSGLQTSVSGNNIVEFRFNDINLPASSVNEPASHGYVVFKIKPKNNLIAGNTIKNTAHITFDFNVPIKTNTATVRVLNLTSTVNKYNTIGELNLFPNPNNGNFMIDFVSKGNYPITINLFDVTGKIVFTRNTQHNNQSIIQISDAVLASGLYNLQISSENDVWNKKVLITK